MGGNVTYLLRSFRISYVSFSGRLPNITELRLQIDEFAVLVEDAFGLFDCLYKGNPQFITANNPVTSLTWDERRSILLFDGSLSFAICPRSLVLRGILRPAPMQNLRISLL